MAFGFSNMRFWFLDDNVASFTDYQTYRQSLVWKLWNRKSPIVTADPVPGDHDLFDERTVGTPPGVSQSDVPLSGDGDGSSAKMLIGNYKDFDPGTPGIVPSPQRDYIIDVDDPLIVGYPIWQYTWFAIQNLSTNDSVVRLQIMANTGPTFTGSFSEETHAADSRILGIIPGTFSGTDDNAGRKAFLDNHTTVPAPIFGTEFPHIVAYDEPSILSPYNDYPDMGKIRWNALAENPDFRDLDARRRIYHAYNNQSSYTIPDDTDPDPKYPYQIVEWVNSIDADRNKITPSGGIIPGRSSNGRQNFDLPSGHTMFGVIIKSYDTLLGAAGFKMGEVTPEADEFTGFTIDVWNIWTSEILLSHLVIS
jgi:hypothetical protein